VLLSSRQLTNLDKTKLKSKHALNFYWDLIQGYIIKAAKKFIPVHHSSQHACDLRPKILKKVYQQLLTIQKLEKLSKKALHSVIISPTWTFLYEKTSGFSAQFAITLPPSKEEDHKA
ncbi:11492_t:CDS:2, partial [Funneliformis geosporum]